MHQVFQRHLRRQSKMNSPRNVLHVRLVFEQELFSLRVVKLDMGENLF
jgi:hypothetical protein